MAPYDYDMVQILHKELDDHGISLYLESSVTAIENGKVTAVKMVRISALTQMLS